MSNTVVWALLPVIAGFSLATAAPAAAEIKVVVTSKPAHALVAGVMGATGTPIVLINGSASPHAYAMKPSDAKATGEATVFIRFSEGLEPFTGKLVKSLPKAVRVVSLQDAPGLKLLGKREGGAFEGHDKNTHKGHGHGHGGASKRVAADDTETDNHVWLDPDNAKIMVDHIAQVLGEVEPASAMAFKANAETTKSGISALAVELERELKPLTTKPFVVFHDAYQYFEKRFGLSAVGSVTVSPEVPPSGKRLSAVRKKIAETGAICVFGEPQFQPKVLRVVTEGSKARTGTLDPEATQLAAGPGLYEALMRNLAAGLKRCFDGPS